jgi:hypothetical protein
MLTSENKLIKEGRHVGLDFYDLLIEALIDPVVSEAGDSLWTLLRAQPTSLRWRCKCGWEPKSRGFRLSEALANQVIRKGWLRRLHFMRPFAPCLADSPASPQVYPVRRCEQAIMTGFSLGGEQFVN